MDKNKTDVSIGEKVRDYLVEKGVETPMTSQAANIDSPETIKEIEELVRKIMTLQGLDLTDDSLEETPKRVSKVLTKEINYGLNYNNFPKCTTVINKNRDDSDLVIVRDIELYSQCEHHLLPVIGKVQIGYIPGNNILGLSKFNRIVDFFARRPQIQERLTKQIYFALRYILDTNDIAVVIDAEHMCVKTRGVLDSCSDTVTSKMGGRFKLGPDSLRHEFLTMITHK